MNLFAKLSQRAEAGKPIRIGVDDVDARDDPNVWQRRMVGITIGDRHDKRDLHDR